MSHAQRVARGVVTSARAMKSAPPFFETGDMLKSAIVAPALPAGRRCRTIYGRAASEPAERRGLTGDSWCERSIPLAACCRPIWRCESRLPEHDRCLSARGGTARPPGRRTNCFISRASRSPGSRGIECPVDKRGTLKRVESVFLSSLESRVSSFQISLV